MPHGTHQGTTTRNPPSAILSTPWSSLTGRTSRLSLDYLFQDPTPSTAGGILPQTTGRTLKTPVFSKELDRSLGLSARTEEEGRKDRRAAVRLRARLTEELDRLDELEYERLRTKAATLRTRAEYLELQRKILREIVKNEDNRKEVWKEIHALGPWAEKAARQLGYEELQSSDRSNELDWLTGLVHRELEHEVEPDSEALADEVDALDEEEFAHELEQQQPCDTPSATGPIFPFLS